MTNTESPVTLATRGLLIGRRDGHLTPEATDTNLEALAGETPDADARDLGLLLACMGKLSESFSAEKPAQDAAALLRSKVANNQHGSLTELLGDHLAQVLVRVEPLSDWTGMLYPGINALYNDGTEALLDLDEDRFGAVLADLTDRVRPFTPDGQAATQMLASIVQMATEVSPFNPRTWPSTPNGSPVRAPRRFRSRSNPPTRTGPARPKQHGFWPSLGTTT